MPLGQRADKRADFLLFGVAFEAGQGEQNSYLLSDGSEGFEFFTREEMGAAVLHVDNADDFVAGNDGSRKEGFVLVFRQFSESLKAGVEIGFLGDGDEAAFAGHPAGEAFVEAEANLAEGAGGRIVGRTKQKVAFVQKIEETRVTVHKFNDESVDGTQDFLETQFFHHEAANLLEKAQLLLSPFELSL